jgi:hypothetical protein
MKRSTFKRKLLKLLKTWESCKMESRTAEAVIRLCEEHGMYPPSVEELTFSKLDGTVLGTMTDGHEWEPEDEKK